MSKSKGRRLAEWLRNLDSNSKASSDTIADDSISTAKLQTDAVTNPKIADGAVHTANLADANVTFAKLHTALVVTESDAIGSNDNDTTIATSAAIKDYVDTQVAGKDALSELSGDSDDITEGSSNLYFTNERVDDRVNSLLTAGTGITLTYDDTANTLTVAGAAQYGDSDVASYLSTNGYGTSSSIIASITDSAPTTLDTLNELAAALGDDANFSTTTATSLGNRLRIDTASQGLTGTQQTNALTNLGITATVAELNYVDGVTSNIQTQLDAKGTSSFSGSYNDLSNKPTIPTNNNQLTNGAGYITGVTNISGYSGQLLREDNRTISPSELTAGRLKFGFTSWANNSTSPYADFLHMRSYTDSSGGSDNLLMFSKSSKNMRLYQQSWGSSTAYSSYVDFWHTGNDGSGSGLDADTVDGIQGSNILTLSGSQTITGTKTFSAASGNIFKLNDTDATNATNANIYFYFQANGSNLGYIGYGSNSTNYLYINNPSAPVYLAGSSVLLRGGYEAWGADNDGSGSGLDADLLDGQQGSYYTDMANSSGQFTTISATNASSRDKIRVYPSSNYAIGMQDNITYGHLNDWAMTFQMNDDTQSDRGFWWGDAGHGLGNGAMSLTTNGRATIATSLSIGQGESITGPNSTTLYVGGNAYINGATYGGLSIGETPTDYNGWNTQLNVHGSSHSRITVKTSNVRMGIYAHDSWHGGTMGHVGTYTNHQLSFLCNAAQRAVLTTAGSLSTTSQGTLWGASNDGSGSGLDADTLDGQHGSYYAPLAAPDFTDEVYTNSSQNAWAFRTTTGSTNNSSGLWFTGTTARLLLRDSSGNIKTMLAANGTNAENVINNNTIWHAGNDGSGSGLDADTVDGIQGGSFLRSDASDTSTGLIDFQRGLGIHREDGVYVTPTSKTYSVYWKFAQSSQLDSPPGSGSWRHVATIQGWSQHSSSYPSWQMCFGNGAFGVRQSTSNSAWASWQTVWTSGNDGSGSGLDADTLDGYNLSTGGVNVVIRTQQNGYILHQNWIQVGNGTGLYCPNGAYLYNDTTYGWFARSSSSSSGSVRLQTSNGTNRGWFYADSSYNQGFLTSAGAWGLKMDNSGNVTATGNVTAYSDLRLKEDIKPLENALAKVLQLRGVQYTRKDTKEKEIGVIAQEIENILPEVVRISDSTAQEEGKETYTDIRSVDYGRMVSVLIEAIKEQQAQINELKEKIKWQ